MYINVDIRILINKCICHSRGKKNGDWPILLKSCPCSNQWRDIFFSIGFQLNNYVMFLSISFICDHLFTTFVMIACRNKNSSRTFPIRYSQKPKVVDEYTKRTSLKNVSFIKVNHIYEAENQFTSPLHGVHISVLIHYDIWNNKFSLYLTV